MKARHRLAHLGNFGEHKWGISVSAISVVQAVEARLTTALQIAERLTQGGSERTEQRIF
jgi:hypothetical protein